LRTAAALDPHRFELSLHFVWLYSRLPPVTPLYAFPYVNGLTVGRVILFQNLAGTAEESPQAIKTAWVFSFRQPDDKVGRGAQTS
jgi:hypothetical protein